MGRVIILPSIIMFKFSVIFCFAILGGSHSQEQDDEGGLCFDGSEVALACTAGTPVREKLVQAFSACFEGEDGEVAEERRGRGKKGCRGRKCKGKGKRPKQSCPTVDSILEKIELEMEQDLCVMSQLGWIDEDGQPINQTMTEDVMSLPQEVSAQLTDDAVGECAMEMAMEMATKLAENPKHARCADKYTQEDTDRLEEVGMMVANYKCFQSMFNKACQGLVRSQIYQLYGADDTSMKEEEKEADRTFGGLGGSTSSGCYSTCSAVNFASTTSCTFGFLVKITRTCNQLFPVLAAVSG